MTIKVTLLGTGTPAPSLEKCGSGFLLEDQQKKVLFDCGPGIVGRLLSIGVKPTEITHFVLTHLHFDHVVDFIRLWLQRWDRGRNSIPPLKIYGPVGFKRFVEQLFGRDGAFAPDIHGRIDHPIQQRIHLLRTGTAVQDWPELAVIELSSGDVVELGGWKIFARSVPHYQPYLENLGYRVETDQGIFAYSSDVSVQPDTKATDPTLEGLRELVHQADITVQHLNSVSTEVGLHEPSPPIPLPAAVVGQLACNASIKTLIATHQGPHISQNETKEQAIRAVTRYFGGEFVWGLDLMTFVLDKQQSSSDDEALHKSIVAAL